MSVLIVVESMFGNSFAVAEAIAEGVAGAGGAVTVTRVTEAAPTIDPAVTLLLVGGPTHAFSMTRKSTREDAIRQGATQAPGGTGIREWIEVASPRAELPVVTFDTRVQVKFVPGSAAKAAASALQHHGFARARRGETFFVEGMPGPLVDGERERARAWGETLAGQA
jgi:flavorubredoxin